MTTPTLSLLRDLKPYLSKLEIQVVKTEGLKYEHKSCNWTIIAYKAAV